MSQLDLKVPGSCAGERLDRFLAAAQKDLSRSRLQALIRAGRVLVAGRPARASQRLRAGERVLVELPEPRQVALLPEAVDDARTARATHVGDRGRVVEQRVHQRAARHPGTGVDDESRGLVHDQQVLVLVQNGDFPKLARGG